MIKLRRVVIILLASSTAIAAEQSKPTGKRDFATMKQEVMERLSSELACVQAASNERAMMACKPRPPVGRIGEPPPAFPDTMK